MKTWMAASKWPRASSVSPALSDSTPWSYSSCALERTESTGSSDAWDGAGWLAAAPDLSGAVLASPLSAAADLAGPAGVATGVLCGVVRATRLVSEPAQATVNMRAGMTSRKVKREYCFSRVPHTLMKGMALGLARDA